MSIPTTGMPSRRNGRTIWQLDLSRTMTPSASRSVFANGRKSPSVRPGLMISSDQPNFPAATVTPRSTAFPTSDSVADTATTNFFSMAFPLMRQIYHVPAFGAIHFLRHDVAKSERVVPK